MLFGDRGGNALAVPVAPGEIAELVHIGGAHGRRVEEVEPLGQARALAVPVTHCPHGSDLYHSSKGQMLNVFSQSTDDETH